jgi:uncharacterized membrane protein (TIGR02234 family)
MAASGLLVLLAVGRPWASAVVDSLAVHGVIAVTGRQAAPVVAGLALVILAAAVLVGIGAPRVRSFALVAGAAAGAGLIGSALRVRAEPSGALAEQARARTGTTGASNTLASQDVSGWPWVVVVAGAFVVVACVAGWLSRQAWGVAGRRYERDPAAAGGPSEVRTGGDAGRVDTLDAWQALSQGDDPTLAG